MEYKVGDLAEMLDGEVLRTTDKNSVLVKIGGKQHNLRLLKTGTNEFEFMLDNTFHHAKILESGSAEVKLIIDGQPLTLKKHSKLTEVLEKASAMGGAGGGDRNLTSQIPGRVVNIAGKPRRTVCRRSPLPERPEGAAAACRWARSGGASMLRTARAARGHRRRQGCTRRAAVIASY